MILNVVCRKLAGGRTFVYLNNLSERLAQKLRSHPAVTMVEQSQVVSVSDMEVPEMYSSEGKCLKYA